MIEMIEHLEALGRGEIDPSDISEGICYEIKNKFGYRNAIHIDYFAQLWPKYSGDSLFPVPCPVGGKPHLRYNKTNDLWNTKYGALRRELCLFIAERMRKLYV